MEKITLHKNISSIRQNGEMHETTPSDDCDHDDKPALSSLDDHDHRFSDVDHFIDAISAVHHDSTTTTLPEIPDSIDTLSKIIHSRIAGEAIIGGNNEDDFLFFDAVSRVSRLTRALAGFPSSGQDRANEAHSSCLNHASAALQSAMAFLEEEFRALLIEESSANDHHSSNVHQPDHHHNLHQNLRKFSSFSTKNRHQQEYADRCAIQREQDCHEFEEYATYPPETVAKLNKIASAMISAGYETECCQVYSISRRSGIRDHMNKLEFEKINMDDVMRMPWESLESEISRWIKVVKNCSVIVFPGEKKLGESVFSDYPLIFLGLSSDLFRVVVIRLLDFAEATAMTKRSAEKLFKYLDMYEALQSLIRAINRGESCSSSEELMEEVGGTADRIGESAACIFCDLENSIKVDAARTPVPGGAVHPLTRYVMNYLKYACEYKDTLERIFAKHADLEKKCNPLPNSLCSQDTMAEKESESPHNATPFSVQVVTVMDLLDENLEIKSRHYRDPSLCYIFLMNNGRYILQKVKGSNEIRQVMGDTWCRRKSTTVRQYHKNYQRETWNRVLQCLNQEGLQVNGKVNKPLLKERFKIFTTTFDDIHRTQSTWVVSDEQLQSELRISVSAVLIPAYRSFVGRFKQYFDTGKQVNKYIKYQPEDIETLIEGLFEGNTASMARRKS